MLNQIVGMRYSQMLAEFCQPYVNKFCANDGMCQQDDSPAHATLYTEEYLLSEDKPIMECLARSLHTKANVNVLIYSCQLRLSRRLSILYCR